MALKQVRILYSAKSFATGLADVKGQVFVDQVAKAVGASAISFTELDSTNAPGVYYAVISAATLAGYSAVAGSALSVYVNSASKSAPSEYKEILTQISTDDLDAHLTTQDGTLSSIQTTASDTNTKVTAIKTDLETGTYSLANLNSAIAAVQSAVAAIQNTTNFSASIPEPIVRPGSGTNSYRIPIRIFNDKGQMADADSNLVTVSVTDQAGVDRGSIMTGYVSGSAPAVRDSAGVYHIDIAIPSSAVLEGLNFTFTYSVNSIAFNQGRVGSIVTDVQADGFALQTTLLSTQTTVNSSNALLSDGTVGLAAANTLQSAIQSLLNNGTYGLAALQSLLANGTYGLSALQAILNNATYGLAAANTLQNSILTSTQASNTTLALVEGSGFSSLTDSLAAISARVYAGGKAV
jgi:hypothetical protein